jgi:hypothetical protein
VDLGPAGAGVLADVGQGFLGDPVEGQPAVGAEVPLGAPGRGDRAGQAGVGFELGGQAGQSLGAGQRVAVEHADGAACFVQPGLGQPVGPVDRVADLRVRARLAGEQLGCLQVQHQAGQ